VGGGALEEGRLLQFHAQALFQRIVKHRIAGSVGEIGEHDRVFVGQKTALPGTPQNSNYDQRGQRLRRPRRLSISGIREPDCRYSPYPVYGDRRNEAVSTCLTPEVDMSLAPRDQRRFAYSALA
jgi:hypothetical protein